MTQNLNAETRDRLHARDQEFLEELFRKLNPYLLHCLSSRGVSGEAAEDVICETWVTFLGNIDSFEGGAKIKTCLTGVLFNKAQEYHRARGKHAQTEEDLCAILDDHFTPEGQWKHAPKDPSALFEQRQSGELIKSFIEGLTHLQRNAFIMKEVEKEETDSICGALGISVSNLGSLIFGAKAKLRVCIEGSVAGSGK